MRVWGPLRRIVPARVAGRRYDFAVQRRSARPGPPPGLDPDVLADAANAAFGSAPGPVRHHLLYSYKGGGAFRVWVDGTGAQPHTFVYKDARLTADVLPAFAGFEGGPGLPEWDVLSQPADAPLRRVHPAVYAAIEVEPGLHYRYLMEDLLWDYRPVSTTPDVRAAIAGLPDVHAALLEWAEARGGYAEHVRFDSSTAPAMLAHARGALEAFHRLEPHDLVGSVLGAWDDVEKAAGSVPEVDAVASVLIHGDFNRGNVFVKRDGSGALKAIDWEWMGRGLPHADLASILKWSAWAVQREEVRRFFAGDGDLGHDEHWRVYLWCRVMRSLEDAALHAAQTAGGRGRTASEVRTHVGLAVEHLAALDHTPTWPPRRRSSAPSRPAVSVVVAGDPAGSANQASLDTIRAQSLPHVEVVVVDAATGAGHLPIGEALQRAGGDYLVWLVPGAGYHPDYLDRCIQALIDVPGPVLAFTHQSVVDPDTGTVSDHLFDAVVRSPFPLKRFRLTQDARRPEVPVSGLIRRSAVEATGLAERPGLSPRALALALALVGPFHEVPEVLLRRPPAVPAAVDEVGSSPEELFAVMFSAPLPPLQRARLVAQTVTYPMRPGRHR